MANLRRYNATPANLKALTRKKQAGQSAVSCSSVSDIHVSTFRITKTRSVATPACRHIAPLPPISWTVLGAEETRTLARGRRRHTVTSLGGLAWHLLLLGAFPRSARTQLIRNALPHAHNLLNLVREILCKAVRGHLCCLRKTQQGI